MTESIGTDKKVILGLIGSQRKLGNCELFIKEVARNVPLEHELRLVRLPALNIRHCRGCYRCLTDAGCPIQDDMALLRREIGACDGLIVASPVYVFGTHGSTKLLLDRAWSLYSIFEKTVGKPCLLINTYGLKDAIGVAPQALLALAGILCLDVKASVNVWAALPGEVLLRKKSLQTAARLGKMLFSHKRMRRPDPACPFCGNNIVTMAKDSFLCTLCHGYFSIDDQGRPVEEQAGWDVWNPESIPKHRDWLRGMKKKFLATRTELARLNLPYRDMGTWVKPDSP
jgi:multimeric flavodoxin WrbA